MVKEIRLGVYSEKAFSIILNTNSTSLGMSLRRCADNEVALVPIDEGNSYDAEEVENNRKHVSENLREFSKQYHECATAQNDPELKKYCHELVFLADFIDGKADKESRYSYLIGQPLDPFKTEAIVLLEKQKEAVKKKYNKEIEIVTQKLLHEMTAEMLKITDKVKELRGDTK